MIEYVIITLILLVFIPMIYIKIKYPFWSHQPIFHTYDYLRFWTKNPYIIQSSSPLKTKYLTPLVYSCKFLDIDDNKLDQLVKFIQEHYVESDKVLTMIDKKDIEQDLSINENPSFISVYNEKKMDYDSKQSTIVEKDIIVGCMTSKAVKIYMNTQDKFGENVYYWDYICSHRNYQDKFIARYLIQSHERYQRLNNLNISASLFKFETGLCPGVVPLLSFYVHTYPIVQVFRPPMSKFSIEKVKGDNVGILFDYLYNITHNIEYKPFFLCIFPDTVTLDYLINNDKIIIYALLQKSKICALYFFKDPKLCYDIDEERNVLECIACISIKNADNEQINSLFFGGFLHSLYDIQQTYNNKFKLITFFEMANSHNIIERWKWKYTPLSITQSAYYLYNAVLPNMPINNKDCLVLL
tara:strand:- start:5645 stop:6880 length:1236 start_codon:yes stop_codon:yes gene_type:complete